MPLVVRLRLDARISDGRSGFERQDEQIGVFHRLPFLKPERGIDATEDAGDKVSVRHHRRKAVAEGQDIAQRAQRPVVGRVQALTAADRIIEVFERAPDMHQPIRQWLQGKHPLIEIVVDFYGMPVVRRKRRGGVLGPEIGAGNHPIDLQVTQPIGQSARLLVARLRQVGIRILARCLGMPDEQKVVADGACSLSDLGRLFLNLDRLVDGSIQASSFPPVISGRRREVLSSP